MEVWKIPCQRNCTCSFSDTSESNSTHIHARQLLSLDLNTFTKAPFIKAVHFPRPSSPSSPTAALGALKMIHPRTVSPIHRSRFVAPFLDGGKHRYTKKAKKAKKAKKTKRNKRQ